MKIGVSSYSYSSLVQAGKLMETEIPKLAKKMGFEILEFAEIHPPEGEDKLEYADRLRQIVEDEGLEMGCYAIAADFLYGSEGDQAKEVERLKREVDIAHRLGSKLMRHDITWNLAPQDRQGRGYFDVIEEMVPGIREVTEYAKSLGIRTMTENHGYFSQDSDRVEKLINRVGSENFGVLMDMGNFLCVDEDPQMAASRLAPYAFHVHAKDFIYKPGLGLAPEGGFFGTRGGHWLRGTIIGHGVVPVVGVLRALKFAGYQGNISIEFEGLEPAEMAIEAGLAFLKKALQEVDL